MDRFQMDIKNCRTKEELVHLLATAPTIMYMIFKNDISAKLDEFVSKDDSDVRQQDFLDSLGDDELEYESRKWME